MMRIHGSTKPDEHGQITFVGQPQDVIQGDVLVAVDEEYAVRDKPKPANNFGRPATEFVLCEPSAYDYETPRGGQPEALGRLILDNRTQVKFRRLVEVDKLDAGEEPNLFYELNDCEDEYGEPLPPDDPHYGHSAYKYEWRGPLREAPKGMLVGINLQPDGMGVVCSEKFIDSVYPTGIVLFSDGTSYQSHPDKEWIGWTTTRFER